MDTKKNLLKYKDAIQSIVDDIRCQKESLKCENLLEKIGQFLEMSTIDLNLDFPSHYSRLVYLKEQPPFCHLPYLNKLISNTFLNLGRKGDFCSEQEIITTLAFFSVGMGKSFLTMNEHISLKKFLKNFEERGLDKEQLPNSIYFIVDKVNENGTIKGIGYFHRDNNWEEQELEITYNHKYQYNAYIKLPNQISKGTVLRLYEINSIGDKIIPSIIVLKPEVMIDITTIAECFNDYTCLPTQHALFNLLTPFTTSWYLLRGAVANKFLDDLLLSQSPSPNFKTSFREVFKNQSLAFTYTDLPDDFNSVCKKQFENIQKLIPQIIEEGFDDSVIEAAFYAPQFGLQGRMDLFSRDGNRILELKSGRPKGDYSPRKSHEIQTTLYRLIAECAYGKSHNRLCFLMYSTTGQLIPIPARKKDAIIAMGLRNNIVAMLSFGAENETNANQLWKTFRNYVLALSTIHQPDFIAKNAKELLECMGDSHTPLLESYQKAYFGFLLREQMSSYKPSHDNMLPDGTHGAHEELSIEEKEIEGKEWTNLKIISTQKAAIDNNSPYTYLFLQWKNKTAPLQPPEVGDLLHIYSTDSNPLAFPFLKGTVEKLDKTGLVFKLIFPQKGNKLFGIDTNIPVNLEKPNGHTLGLKKQYRSLLDLGAVEKSRRDLLLTLRNPEPPNLDISKSETDITDIDRIVSKALAAKDYFLLLGPPGTGKTSFALKGMVESLVKQGKRIMLTAYTNLAVDEICTMLKRISHIEKSFVRITRESSTPDCFKEHLLNHQLTKKNNRIEIAQFIDETQVFVGTTLSILNNELLWYPKPFDVLIVDEAAQLLEPQILGLLCAQTANNELAFEKFILIGDHKQLPAVVAQKKLYQSSSDPLLKKYNMSNLASSLFERLLSHVKKNRLNYAFEILSQQGRMHPDIAQFPSNSFYGSKLKPLMIEHQKINRIPYHQARTNEICSKSLEKYGHFLSNNRVLYINTSTSSSSRHKENEYEVNTILDLLESIILLCSSSGLKLTSQHIHIKDEKTLSIGIITPYRNQVVAIKRRLSELRERESLANSYETIEDLISKMVIDTVERYQGSQRDIIIYSTCSNYPFQMNFLTAETFWENDSTLIDRKFNVALTRARHQIILLGNKGVLTQSPIYNKFIQEATTIDTLEKKEQ